MLQLSYFGGFNKIQNTVGWNIVSDFGFFYVRMLSSNVMERWGFTKDVRPLVLEKLQGGKPEVIPPHKREENMMVS